MSASMVMKHKQVIEKKYEKNEQVSIFKRGIAFFIDWYIGSVLVSFPVIVVLDKINPGQDPVLELRSLPFDMAVIACLSALIVALIYYVLIPYKWNGQTLGKKIMKLKISERNKTKVSFLALLKRQVLGIMLVEGSLFSITPLIWQVIFYQHASYQQTLTWVYYGLSLISVILVLFTKNKRAIHDYISNTTVTIK